MALLLGFSGCIFSVFFRVMLPAFGSSTAYVTVAAHITHLVILFFFCVPLATRQGSSKNLLLSLRLETEGLEHNDEDELEEELPLHSHAHSSREQSSKGGKRSSAPVCSPSRLVPTPFGVFSLYVSNTFRLLMYAAICVSIGLTFVDSEKQIGTGLLDVRGYS